jgi:hypothetical protein
MTGRTFVSWETDQITSSSSSFEPLASPFQVTYYGQRYGSTLTPTLIASTFRPTPIAPAPTSLADEQPNPSKKKSKQGQYASNCHRDKPNSFIVRPHLSRIRTACRRGPNLLSQKEVRGLVRKEVSRKRSQAQERRAQLTSLVC